MPSMSAEESIPSLDGGSTAVVVTEQALLVQKLSRSSSADVSDFGYDACDEHICLATNLPDLAPGRLAEPGAAEGP